jgi:hypothetical protein
MDSICSVLSLQKLLNFFSAGTNSPQGEFDVVVYDCNNTEEFLRLTGATERARYRFSVLGCNLTFLDKKPCICSGLYNLMLLLHKRQILLEVCEGACGED